MNIGKLSGLFSFLILWVSSPSPFSFPILSCFVNKTCIKWLIHLKAVKIVLPFWSDQDYSEYYYIYYYNNESLSTWTGTSFILLLQNMITGVVNDSHVWTSEECLGIQHVAVDIKARIRLPLERWGNSLDWLNGFF